MSVIKPYGVPMDQLIDPKNVNTKEDWSSSSQYEGTVPLNNDQLILELQKKIRELESIIDKLQNGKTIID